jgi:hypothetical protein
VCLAQDNLPQTIDVVALFSLKPKTPEIVCFEPNQTSDGLNPIIWSQTIDRAIKFRAKASSSTGQVLTSQVVAQ